MFYDINHFWKGISLTVFIKLICCSYKTRGIIVWLMVTIRKNYLRDITFRNAYVSKFHIYKLNIIYKYKKKF